LRGFSRNVEDQVPNTKYEEKKVEKQKNCPRGLVTLGVGLSQPGQCGECQQNPLPMSRSPHFPIDTLLSLCHMV
jgi:hypothetical protein